MGHAKALVEKSGGIERTMELAEMYSLRASEVAEMLNPGVSQEQLRL